jgi:hypothetical protein
LRQHHSAHGFKISGSFCIFVTLRHIVRESERRAVF